MKTVLAIMVSLSLCVGASAQKRGGYGGYYHGYSPQGNCGAFVSVMALVMVLVIRTMDILISAILLMVTRVHTATEAHQLNWLCKFNLSILITKRKSETPGITKV